MSKSISLKTLKQWRQPPSACTVLDVRRQADFEADDAKITGAIWKNPETVNEWADTLKGKTVALYCVKGGSVSQSVADALAESGVDAAYLDGGIKAWKDAGGDIEPK